MALSFDALTYHRPTSADADEVLALIIRGDVSEYGQADSDLEDLLNDWGHVDLEHDALLARGPAGELLGYAAVLPWGDDLRYDFHVDPTWSSPDLGRELLSWCEGRGAAIADERQGGGAITAKTFVAHVNDRDRIVVESAGFQPGRYYFQMWVDMTGDESYFREPLLPAGVSVRPFQVGQDERVTYGIIQAAFGQPGRQQPAFEDWSAHMLRSDIFDPELWFLAVHGDKIVGACLAFLYQTGGWVRQLGVDANWRQRGIGAALLRHTFVQFKKRGEEKVGLSVESFRPDAHAFYQKVGMKQERQYDEFVKGIEINAQSTQS